VIAPTIPAMPSDGIQLQATPPRCLMSKTQFNDVAGDTSSYAGSTAPLAP
jgi:hypothetical protein